MTAYVMRFIHHCRHKKPAAFLEHLNITIALTASEYDRARSFWIGYIQGTTLSPVISELENRSTITKGPLSTLTPFLDRDHILRVGGRLQLANLKYEQKHPAILAAHPLVDLIVRHTHIKLYHAGLQLTLSTLCQQFWLLRARSITRRIIHSCVSCVRQCASIMTQLMGQLPPARLLNPRKAFEHCGLDYAGPINLRTSPGRGHKSYKGYIALFVCLASRAIHLELVSGYSTSAFLDAFARFCSRRGLPTTMYSDNGTTFVGADKELTLAYRSVISDPNLINRIVADNIQWKFIPPHAPHFGGLWEAGVRSVKQHLRRVLGSHTLTFEEFSTLLCQIEACLNSRPIGPLHDDPDYCQPLTPGHFLIGTALNLPPQSSLMDLNPNRLARWQVIRQMTEQFWRLWHSDYVNTLQQRHKWRSQNYNIDIGTLVLIKNPLLPPCKWELGRVTQCHPGSDGLTRVVTIRTAISEYKRPIVKLCILPVDVNNKHGDEICDVANDNCD